MAQVPYSPVPSVVPNAQGVQAPRLDTPTAAFGGATAKAQEGLGTAMIGAGDELFKRALAMQELANHTEAQEAATDYVIEAGKLHADFNSLQGRDRVLAFPKYQENLKNMRTGMRDKLSNPMSQKLFDNESFPTLARTIFNGAGVAASAQKEWTINVQKSRLELDLKQVNDNPTDDGFFTEKLGRIVSSSRNLAAQMGLPAGSDQEKVLITANVSKAWSERLIGLARTDPIAAGKLFDANKTQMTSTDLNRTETVVIAQRRALGSSIIAAKVFDPDRPLKEMEEAARVEAGKIAKDDPLLADQAVRTLQTKYNQFKHSDKWEKFDRGQTVSDTLVQHQPKDLRDFLRLPGADKLYEQMTPSEKLALPAKISNYASAVNKQANAETMLRLYGMRNSDDPDAREQFLNIDPTQEKLSQDQMRTVMGWQKQLKGSISQDVRVSKAMSVIRGAKGAQLQALGIYARTKDNAEDYDKFTGALQTALDTHMEIHKRPATGKDIVEDIAPRLLAERTEKGLLWNSNVPFFKQNVPSGFADEARRVSGNPNLTEAEIYNLYVRLLYRKVYRPTKSGDRPPSAPTSR